MVNYLILGSGIAGRRAAEAIRANDSQGNIVIIEEQQEPYYTRPMLAEVLAKGLKPKSSIDKDRKLFANLRADLRSGVAVKELRISEQQALLSDNELLSFDKLLIASGKGTRQLAFDDGNTTGIVYLDRLHHALAINSVIGSVKRAVIYGSSFQGMSAIYGLRNKNIDLTLVVPDNRIWPGILDNMASSIVEERLQQEGVNIIKNAEIHLLEKNDSALSGIVVSGGRKIATDLLVVGMPQVPALDYIKPCDIISESGIKTNSQMQTNETNIYAAGDVAQLTTEADASKAASQTGGWLRAWKQGYIAGANMAGGDTVYDGLSSLRTKVLNLDVVCLGLSDAQGDNIQIETGDFPYPELPSIYKKLVYRDGKIVGALFIGDVSEASVVDDWIRQGLKKNQCDKKVLDKIFSLSFHNNGPQGVLCPVCKFHMQTDGQQDGGIITCPACGIDFSLEVMKNKGLRAVHVDLA